MKKTVFMSVFLSFLLFGLTVYTHADTVQQDQATTEFNIELKRKILPDVFPEETPPNEPINGTNTSGNTSSNSSSSNSDSQNRWTHSKESVTISASTDTLPKTGEQASYWITGLGVGLLGFLLFFFIYKNKKKRGVER